MSVSQRKEPVQLVSAGPAFSEVISVLHGTCFESGWTNAACLDVLNMPGVFAWLAKQNEQPVGFVIGQTAADESEIITIGTLPDHRLGHIGQQLLTVAIEAVRNQGVARLFLEVAEDNRAALALYRKNGFEQVGRRKAYYRRQDGQRIDALVLALDVLRNVNV